MLDAVLAACAANRARDLADLTRLLAQPSISTQNIGVRDCAALVQTMLAEIGLAPRLIETPGHPILIATWTGAPGQPTLLLYGHYDVQPPEPLDQWHSPPFAPTLRDGRLYARGVGDNKGQFFAHIAALRAWLETAGTLPINIKLLLEGEEECGSPNLDTTVRAHRDLLAADLVVTADGPVLDDANPQVAFGCRGLLYVELRARGARHDLHSGNWGGIAPNAAWRLVHLLTTMLDADNTIRIAGFHDAIRPLTPAARAALDAIPLDQRQTLAGIGSDRLPPPADVPYFDRLMARPTLNLAGIAGGYSGAGSKTVIPATALAKLDMRLVPDQHPDDILAKVTAHVARYAPEIEVAPLGRMEPSFTPLEHPLAEPVRRAVSRGFGRHPLDIPLLGGSLPDATWTKTLGLPSFVVPYGNAAQANHAPNEHMALDRFHAGIRTSAALLAELANG